MSIGNTLTFYMPEGWTLRAVASALANEWLTPFRAKPAHKTARWILQSVISPEKSEVPLWEPGISTAEYELRLDNPDLTWDIRVTAGRGRSTTLARLALSKEQPGSFHLTCADTAFPETLFDAEKLDQFLQAEGKSSEERFFATLLSSHGFQVVE